MKSKPRHELALRNRRLENLLASFHLSLAPLRKGRRRDRSAYDTATRILRGFAKRHGVRTPAQAVAAPLRADAPHWDQESAADARSLIGWISALYRDLGVGNNPATIDGAERVRFARLLLRLLHRHGALTLTRDGGKLIGVAKWLPPSRLDLPTLFSA